MLAAVFRKIVTKWKCVTLLFSEREDPGNEKFTNVEIPKVIGGLTQECQSGALDSICKYFST